MTRVHPPEVVLVEENGRLVATTNPPTEPMTTDDLLHVIDESREWPRSDRRAMPTYALVGATFELVE